jgi:hypothetical protein
MVSRIGANRPTRQFQPALALNKGGASSGPDWSPDRRLTLGIIWERHLPRRGAPLGRCIPAFRPHFCAVLIGAVGAVPVTESELSAADASPPARVEADGPNGEQSAYGSMPSLAMSARKSVA